MIREFDACLKCSLCELHCPVLRVSPEFPGPKNGGPGLERLRQAGRLDALEHLDLCLGCRTCDTVCPSGLMPAELIAQPKHEHVERHGLSLRDWMLTHAPLMGPLAVRTSGIANRALKARPVRWAMERTLRIDRRRPMPAYAARSFRQWFAGRRSPWQGGPAPNGKVAYFHGCSAQFMEPHIGRHVVEVLERNDFEVILPEQRCCGLPLIANGALKEATAWGRSNVNSLLPLAEQGIPVVVSSTSCSLTLKHDYAHVLKLEGAEALSSQVFDLFEFLDLCLDEGRLKTDFRVRPERLPYHQPCHQRAQGIGVPVVRLLSLIPGVEAWSLEAGCCGSAGTYGYKQEKYEVSMAVGEPLRQALIAARVQRAVSDCETCRWQIEHLTGLSAVHPITVLWEAYGLEQQ